MKKLTIKASNSCCVVFGNGIIDEIGSVIRKKLGDFGFCRVVVVTDSNVYGIYGRALISSFEKANFEVSVKVLQPGEQFKNISTSLELYEFFLQNKVTRNSLIVAFGGGVIGDLTGFVAASFLRGVPLVQIPTTLLAQVDSSIGGKSAINLDGGKNLVGFVRQPVLVICDFSLLSSLNSAEFFNGIGEIVKYAAIFSKKLFIRLEQAEIFDILEDVVLKCVKLKKRVVEIDEFEKNERTKLNFGHTVAHSLEKYYGFGGICHGQAVALGMVYVTEKSEKFGLTRKGEAERIKKLLKKFGLETEIKISASDIFENSLTDKKMHDGKIKLVLISKIGGSFTVSLTLDEYRKFLVG